jgi:hypothetical protein
VNIPMFFGINRKERKAFFKLDEVSLDKFLQSPNWEVHTVYAKSFREIEDFMKYLKSAGFDVRQSGFEMEKGVRILKISRGGVVAKYEEKDYPKKSVIGLMKEAQAEFIII